MDKFKIICFVLIVTLQNLTQARPDGKDTKLFSDRSTERLEDKPRNDKTDSSESDASNSQGSVSREDEKVMHNSTVMMGDEPMHSDGRDSMKCTERIFAITEAEKMCLSMPNQNITTDNSKGGFFKRMKDGFSRGIEMVKNATRETINKAKKKLGIGEDDEDYLYMFSTEFPSEFDGMFGYRGMGHPPPPTAKSKSDMENNKEEGSNKTCEYYRCILNSIHVTKNSGIPDESLFKSWVVTNISDNTEKIALQERLKECFTEVKSLIDKVDLKMKDKSSSSSEEIDLDKSGCDISLKLMQCLSKNAECPTFTYP